MALVAFGLAGELAGASALAWDPIPAEHRAAKPPADAPDAAAEILHWRIDLVVKDYKATQRNFQRIKIYSERAVEELGKLGLEFTESERISEMGVRVIHPDGQTVVLPESQFQETVVGRWAHGRRIARRLVVPRLTPGDIVDLQYRMDEDGRFKGSRFIYCQQTIPVRKFEFLLRNSQSGPMNLAYFRSKDAKIEGQGTMRGRLVINNLPAYVEESDMPPLFNARASMLLAYGKMPAFDAELWSQAIVFLQLYKGIKCAATKDLRQVAAEVTAKAQYREDKLRKLYEYCQAQVANTAYDESPESRAERFVYHEPRTAQETWKVRRGSPLEVNCLFAALAGAAGFEAQLAFSADRDQVLSVQFSHGWFFMKSSGVLVRVEGEWRLFAPGDRAVPFGRSRWQREETESFVLDDERYIHWVEVQTSFKEQAKRTRHGQLVVDEQGGCAGEITETLTGQLAIAWREDHWAETPAQLEQAVRKEVQEMLPYAEVVGVRLEHFADTEAPLVLRYSLRLANYGTITGDHMVLMPDLFQLRAQPRYPEATRVNAIQWRHAWREEDIVDLTLPKSFVVGRLDPVAPVHETGGIVHQEIAMELDAATNCLHYRREQTAGRPGATTFTNKSYDMLKQLFDEIHRAKTKSIVVRISTGENKSSHATPVP